MFFYLQKKFPSVSENEVTESSSRVDQDGRDASLQVSPAREDAYRRHWSIVEIELAEDIASMQSALVEMVCSFYLFLCFFLREGGGGGIGR